MDRRLTEDIIGAADGRFAYLSFLADRMEKLPPGGLAELSTGKGLCGRSVTGLELDNWCIGVIWASAPGFTDPFHTIPMSTASTVSAQRQYDEHMRV